MFIDENGNAGNINNVFSKLLNKVEISKDENYFTITGVIFEKKNYSIMRNNVRKLKERYWNNGFYFDTKHNDTRYVCLHSRDIRNHTGAFNEKLINYDKFIVDLSNVLKDINCKIISVSINLTEYVRKNETVPLYEKAFDLLLERFIYATKNNKKSIIMLESRGKKDDSNLLKHICNVIHENGIKNISNNELLDKISGVYFNPKWYSSYSSTYSGLEIADLFSYPIHQYIKYKDELKDKKSFESIENKIDCYPNYNNKGIKIYPKEKDDIHHP